jgi:hypothetical protein
MLLKLVITNSSRLDTGFDYNEKKQLKVEWQRKRPFQICYYY